MKRVSLLCAVFAGVLALYGSGAAHAETVAQLACGSTVTANLGYYDLGFTNAVPDSGSGSGVGKVTYLPLHFHTASVNFPAFFTWITGGKHVQTCTLTVIAEGETILYTFSDLFATGVTAIGQSATEPGEPNTSYLDVQLNYQTVTVQTNGPDNGGTDNTGTRPKSSARVSKRPIQH